MRELSQEMLRQDEGNEVSLWIMGEEISQVNNSRCDETETANFYHHPGP